MISLAHGWYIDEFLWFVIPVGLSLWVLRRAERRARTRAETLTDPATEAGADAGTEAGAEDVSAEVEEDEAY
jgi:hypothetical protein